MDKSKSIPREFYSSETNQPMENCLICQRTLLDSTSEYFIERIFRRVPKFNIVEPLFEYAVCIDCAVQMRDGLSKESKQKIETYFRQHLKLEEGAGNSLDHCLLTGKSIDQSVEFSYHAHCKGSELIESFFPYAISDQAMDEISELLSDETVDELNRFKGKYFTGPPEVADLINPRTLVPL